MMTLHRRTMAGTFAVAMAALALGLGPIASALSGAPQGNGTRQGDKTPAPTKVEFKGWFSNPVFSADGKTLVYAELVALGPNDRTAPTHIVFMDLTGGKGNRSVDGPADDSLIGSLAVTPDKKHAAIGLWNTAVRLLDLSTGKQTDKIEKSNGARQLTYSPDGSTLAWLRDGEVYLADATSGKVLRHFGKENDLPVTNFLFADNGKQVIIGNFVRKEVAGGGGKNRPYEYQTSFWAYDATSGMKLHQVGTTVSEVRKLFDGPPAYSAFAWKKGNQIVLAGPGGPVQICDAVNGKKEKELPAPWKQDATDPLRRLIMAGNAQVAALVSARGVVTVWDVMKAKQIGRLETGQSLEHVALSPDGGQLAVTYQTPGKVGAVLLVYKLGAR